MLPSASIRIQESRKGDVFKLPGGLGAGAAAGASCCAKAPVSEKLTISAPPPASTRRRADRQLLAYGRLRATGRAGRRSRAEPAGKFEDVAFSRFLDPDRC